MSDAQHTKHGPKFGHKNQGLVWGPGLRNLMSRNRVAVLLLLLFCFFFFYLYEAHIWDTPKKKKKEEEILR